MQPWEVKHARADAMLRLDEGDLPAAKQALDELISRLSADDAQLRSEIAQCYIDRATIARLANDWNGALSDLKAAAEIAERMPLFPRRSLLVNVHLIRAKIYSTNFARVFDLDSAHAALVQLAALWSGHWMVDELESHIAFQRGDWNLAATKALGAASALQKENWLRGVAACRRRAGEAFLELGRLDEAKEQLEAARAFFAEHGPPDLLGETALALGRLESRLLNHDAAWSLAQQALEEVESRVRRFADVGEQQRFVIDKLRFYDHAFDIGLSKGGTEGWLRAWTIAERSKSFYLAQLLANAEIPLFNGVDPKSVSKLEALERELDGCERTLGNLSASERTGGREEELEVRLRTLSDERSAMLQGIMKTNPQWARLRNPPAFDAARFLQSCPGVIPVSFFWRNLPEKGATLHVFASTASGRPVHHPVFWDRAELEALNHHAERLRGQVDEYADLLPEGTTERVFPNEIRRELPEEACLLISAHGTLRGLPLHALPLDGLPLIAQWAVQYVPSLALSLPPKRTAPASAVLLMGSSQNSFGDLPLKDVESELVDLEQLWIHAGRKVVARMIAHDLAPEDVGWPPQKWSQFALLHFACHGKFLEERPFDSALRLGRDAVRGSELFATKLTADVVVLSACALGQRARRYGNTDVVSEEWIGLYLPLFYAGARSLVVSLWDANSQVARQFMVAFHEALAAGGEPHAAFRSAMLRVRLKLPARWANWCLVGLP